MTIKIEKSAYKDQPAITVESQTIRAQYLPGIGAKMASLVYKPRDFELMVQAPGDRYLTQPYDGSYVDAECTGFDDMFPTIDLCYYDRFPWQGTRMADHGEVWSLPWTVATEGDRLHLEVYGVRFPYKLEKWVGFHQDSILRLDYRLTNLSAFNFDFLWAAHMMINIEQGAELVVPVGVERIVGTLDVTGAFGSYGDEYEWPVATMPDGERRDLRTLRPRSTGNAYKYFIKGQMPEGWCGLRYHTSNFSLVVSFPRDRVPYLGILPNEGGWRGHYNVFLEPCTASFDRPDAARYRDQVSTVEAGSIYEWHLNISLAEGVGFGGATEDGEILAAGAEK